MGNAMLKNIGINIGKSVCDEGYESLVKEILEKSKIYNCEIYYPKDVVVSESLNGNGKIKKSNDVNNEEMILDIGPETIKLIKNIVN